MDLAPEDIDSEIVDSEMTDPIGDSASKNASAGENVSSTGNAPTGQNADSDPSSGRRTSGDDGEGELAPPPLSESSLALRVPSAVVPAEGNALINPDHPRFEEAAIDGPLDPDIDDRLT